MASPLQTPYLHLSLNGSAEENRNWSIIDSRMWQAVARIVGDLIGPGMITIEMLAPDVQARLVPLPGNPKDVLTLDSSKTAIWQPPPSGLPPPASGSPGDVLTLDTAGNPVWATSAASVTWLDDPTWELLTPYHTPRDISLPLGHTLWFGDPRLNAGDATYIQGSNDTLAMQLLSGQGLISLDNTSGITLKPPATKPITMEIGTQTILQVLPAGIWTTDLQLQAAAIPAVKSGLIHFAGDHFWASDGTTWSQLDNAPAPNGLPPGGLVNQILTKNSGTNFDAVWRDPAAATSLWADDTINDFLKPVNFFTKGVLLASGMHLQWGDPSTGNVGRLTGVMADDNSLRLYAGTNGILFGDLSGAMSSWMTPTGLLRLGSAGAAPTERLELATGGIQVAAALTTKDGTIQYTAGHFQGRVAGVWTQLDNAAAPAGLLPTGGTAGQYLKKNTATDYDASWAAIVPGASDGSLGTQTLYTANATLTTANQDSLINCFFGNVTLTLPPFNTNLSGKLFRLTRVDLQNVNIATILPNGADFIDGVNAFITIAPNESVTLMACGTVANNQQWVRVSDPTWRTIFSGNILTPRDPNKILVSQSAGVAMQWGARTVKGRVAGGLVADAYATAFLSLNTAGPAFSTTDSTGDPSWLVRLAGAGTAGDHFAVLRAPATSVAPTFAQLMTLDATGNLTIPAAGTGDPLIVGSRTVKGRITAPTSGDAVSLQINRNAAGTFDDTAQSTWRMVLRPTSNQDNCTIYRAPPAGAEVALLTLDNLGMLTLPGDPATRAQIVLGGTTTAKARVLAANAGAAASWISLGCNRDPYTGSVDDTTKAAWQMTLNPTNDNFVIGRQPSGGGYGNLLTLDNAGNLTITGKLNVTATSSQVQAANTNTTFSFSTYDTWSGAVVTFPAIVCRGGIVFISGALNLTYTQLGSSGGANILVGLYRNGVQQRQYASRVGGSVITPYPWAFFMDWPGAGTWTYDLRIVIRSGTSAVCGACSDVSNLHVLEVC